MIWLVLMLCIVAAPVKAELDTEAERELSPKAQQYRQQISEILDDEPFNNTATVTRWRLKGEDGDTPREELFPEWIIDILEFFERNEKRVVAVSRVVEVVLWIVFGAVIIWLIIRYREQLAALLARLIAPSERRELPSSMFGLEISKESLPDDVVAESQLLWRQGEVRRSIGLLLRASLSRLLHDYDCRFEASDTEEECYSRVASMASNTAPDQQARVTGISAYMRSLVTVWQQLAYGHQTPEDETFQALCRQWQEVF